MVRRLEWSERRSHWPRSANSLTSVRFPATRPSHNWCSESSRTRLQDQYTEHLAPFAFPYIAENTRLNTNRQRHVWLPTRAAWLVAAGNLCRKSDNQSPNQEKEESKPQATAYRLVLGNQFKRISFLPGFSMQQVSTVQVYKSGWSKLFVHQLHLSQHQGTSIQRSSDCLTSAGWQGNITVGYTESVVVQTRNN